ncbi:hypothetical protein D9619_012349 [Psilocybe cf. subviscida]|uniref:Uncharacterized protein n=1 Tax=Psilocybe cf. subviscida TaxID=2480587 RepID=A0A8H5ERB1_9AGAR|nr:hypothetical protein D9619_012349 [Psilocybe cf. subviscida]
MLWSLLTTFVLAGFHVQRAAAASGGPSGCVSFDINWNLLAFGVNGKDYNAGAQSTWTSSTAPTDITASGRPPFDSVNATCYLSQFTNAIYFLNVDSANPSDIYIYDATAKSWSTQTVTTNAFDPLNFATILDHDTNVFYAYSKGELWSLDMALLKAANSTPIPWNDVQAPDLSPDAKFGQPANPGGNTAGYQPTIALAQNHVHFMGVPGVPAGSAKIFVIHFSFMQPEPQSYGNAFPDSHGKTASFFLDEGVQQEFAFIPDDGSATYVVNVETNTTKTLTGPSQQDPFAFYSASTSALVQLTSDGHVAFLPYDPKTTTSGGTWTAITKIPTATSTSGSSPGGNSTASPLGGASPTGGSSTTGGNTSANTTGSGSSPAGTAAGKSAGVRVALGPQGVFGALLGVAVAVVGVVAL